MKTWNVWIRCYSYRCPGRDFFSCVPIQAADRDDARAQAREIFANWKTGSDMIHPGGWRLEELVGATVEEVAA